MKCRSSFLAGIILLLANVFGATIGLENLNPISESSDIIPTRLVNCSTTSDPNYQCVKIEDCRTKRRRGSRRFCKWDGRPTHVCCREKSADDRLEKLPSSEKQKRWSDEVTSWEIPSWNYRRRFRNRFDHHHEPECGVLENEERGRILAAAFAGTPVRTAASTPWMVAIGETQDNGKPKWFCGGALLSRKIVVTAAHCITKSNANLARVGELDLTSNTEPADPQDSEIESSVIHPDYKQPLHYNDIAIIRLKTPVRYTKYVRPICLPRNDLNLHEDDQATLTGWGNIELGGKGSPILQEIQISVVSNSRCNAIYGDSWESNNAQALPRGIIDAQLCARDEYGRADACQGDSGGPLVKKVGRRRVVIGIVSSGPACGSTVYPGIHTRVSHYTGWLRSFL